MKKRYIFLYIVFFFVIILLGIWKSISNERISLYLTNYLNQLDSEIYFNVVNAETTLTGLQVEKLELKPVNQFIKNFELNDLNVSILNWRLLLGQIPIEIGLYEKTIFSYFHFITSEVTVLLENFDLNQLPAIEGFNILQGQPFLSLQINYNFLTLVGRLDFSIKEVNINSASFLFSYYQIIDQPLDIGSIAGTVDYQGGQVEFDIKSKGNLTSHLTGTLSIAKPIFNSTMNLKLKGQINQQVLKQHNTLRPLISIYARGNQIDISIQGNIFYPSIKKN